MRRFLASLEVPIIAAPMAGGANTPHFVSEVARCGGIGSFGFAYSASQTIAADLQAVPQERRGRVNVNFFVFPETVKFSDEDFFAAKGALESVCSLATTGLKLQLPVASAKQPWHLPLEEQLEHIWKFRPGLLTFHFGLPPPFALTRAHALGMLVGATATSAAEARALEVAGVDFVVAQGVEAGGHRGVMDPYAPDDQLPTLALVAALRAAGVALPVIAAGGLMTGAQIQVFIPYMGR